MCAFCESSTSINNKIKQEKPVNNNYIKKNISINNLQNTILLKIGESLKRIQSRSKVSLDDIDKQTIQSKAVINLGTNPFMDTIQSPSCTSIQDILSNQYDDTLFNQIESRQLISPNNIKSFQQTQFLKPPVNNNFKGSQVQKSSAPFQKKNLKNLLSKLDRKRSDEENDFTQQDSITDENPNIEFKVQELNNNQTSIFTKFEVLKKKTEKSQKDINSEQINSIQEMKNVVSIDQEARNPQNVKYSHYLELNPNKINTSNTFNNYHDNNNYINSNIQQQDIQSINITCNQAKNCQQRDNFVNADNLVVQSNSSYQQNQIQNFNNFGTIVQTKSLDNQLFQQISQQSPKNLINQNLYQNQINVQPIQNNSISQMLKDSNLMSSNHQQHYLSSSPISQQIYIKSPQVEKEKQTINNLSYNQNQNSMSFNQQPIQDMSQNGYNIEGGNLFGNSLIEIQSRNCAIQNNNSGNNNNNLLTSVQYPISSLQVLQSPQKQSQNNLSFYPNYQVQMSQQQLNPEIQNQDQFHLNYSQKRSQSYGNLGQSIKQTYNQQNKINGEVQKNEKQNFVKNPPFIIGSSRLNQSDQKTNSLHYQSFETNIQLNTQNNRSPQSNISYRAIIDQNLSNNLQEKPIQNNFAQEQNLNQFNVNYLPVSNQQMSRSQSTQFNKKTYNNKSNSEALIQNKGKITPTTNNSFSSANQSFCNNNSMNIVNINSQTQINQKPAQSEKENPITRLRNKSLTSSQQQKVSQLNKQNIQEEESSSKEKMNFNCMMQSLLCNKSSQVSQENRSLTPQGIKNETPQISQYQQKGDMSPLSSQATPINNAASSNLIKIAQVIQIKDGNIINPVLNEKNNLSANQNAQFTHSPFKSPQKTQFQQLQNYSLSSHKSPNNVHLSYQPRIVNINGKGDIYKDRLSPYGKDLQKEKNVRSQSCQKTLSNKIENQGTDKLINKSINGSQRQTPTLKRQKSNVIYNGSQSNQKVVQVINQNVVKQIQNSPQIKQFNDENRIYSTNLTEKQFQPIQPDSPIKSVEPYSPFDKNRNSVQSFQYDLSSIKNRVSSFHIIPQQQTHQQQPQYQQDEKQITFSQPINNQELVYQQLTSSQLKQSQTTNCFQNNCLGSYCFGQNKQKSQNSQNSQVLNTSNAQNDQSLNAKKITSQQLDKSGRLPLQQNNVNIVKKELQKNAIQVMRIHQKSTSISSYSIKYGQFK